MGEKISEPTPEELLENAHVILEEVDNAPIFKEETENREFPAFARKGKSRCCFLPMYSEYVVFDRVS
jgi:hypothetical protein